MGNRASPDRRKAYAYVRVSTAEQAQHQTSLRQQTVDLKKYCTQNDIDLIEIFVEPGLSGSDWKRPEFNRMMLLATGDDHPVDCIIACDMARLARDVEFTVITQGQLQRAGVQCLFVYQRFEDNHFGMLHKLLTSWQDQDAIVKASMNTRRGLRGTAEEGFWVGGTVPLGYESRTVEVRSKKEKKKLFLNASEAAIVRMIFDLAEKGLNGSPLGGRAIAEYLNKHGYTRRGKKFYNATVAGILSRPHYLGRFPGNKFDEFGNLLPEEEWTWVDCPQLITQEQFDRVAALREERAPRNTPPRVVSGPTLLIGLAECEACGAGMTIRTGKGGRYRYYSCNSKVNRGASACDCPNVRAEKLDELVLGEVADRVFGEEHLEPLLTKVLDTSDEGRQRKLQELEQCEAKLADARRRLSNLHDAIETGAVSPRDPDITARLKQRRTEIDGLNTTVTTLHQQLERGPARITSSVIQRFGDIVRRELKHGKDEARQQIARAFIEKIRIGPKVEISGQTDALAHGAASVARSKGEVPNFDRKWCQKRTRTRLGPISEKRGIPRFSNVSCGLL
ncbi:recombinase family protein [Alteriqipengyuania flavescens]|uniref:recombinase family protein n=2 Tax=Erythrobacteraceae TaxID=335929 RepID=UPI0025B302A7|nr:recombinase family protein [Alteriqipengyuania flavescens]WJY19861.1 recombinase family protein [Alteriqipengyuania flavescens]WJY25803.1 recombinase family protein [Alteriqipengyuania flavescens]